VHLLAHHFPDKLHKLVLFLVAEVRSKATERLILANKNIHDLEAHGIFSVSFLLLRHKQCAVKIAEEHELNLFKGHINHLFAVFLLNSQPVLGMLYLPYQMNWGRRLHPDSAPV
jgi:hypothetical protein